MNIYEMSVSDFRRLKRRDWNEDIGEFDSLVVIPAQTSKLEIFFYDIKKKIIQSLPGIFREPMCGYRMLDFCATKGLEPICLLSEKSHTLYFDGIGGYGKDWLRKYGKVPEMVPPVGYCIDFLPNSGLLRIFLLDGKLTCGPARGSLELFGEK